MMKRKKYQSIERNFLPIKVQPFLLSIFSRDFCLYIMLFLLIIGLIDFLCIPMISMSILFLKEKRVVFFFIRDVAKSKSNCETKLIEICNKANGLSIFVSYIFCVFLMVLMIPTLIFGKDFWSFLVI